MTNASVVRGASITGSNRVRVCERPQEVGVVRIRPDELRSGLLGTLFRSGARAVILDGDERVGEIWSALIGSRERGASTEPGEECPWEATISDIARNHMQDQELGDMLRFVPGQAGYIARKALVFPSVSGTRLECRPAHFWNRGRSTEIPQNVRSAAWTLISDILASTLPSGFRPPGYAVAVERLKYPGSAHEYQALADLLGDSGGTWSKLAQRLDVRKPLAAGPFDKRVVRDLFAACCSLPLLGAVVRRLNERMRRWPQFRLPDGANLIGRPHVDWARMVTALAGDRDVLRTEIYVRKQWVELPLAPHSLAIFPSGQLDRSLGIAPTPHRVLMMNGERPSTGRPNVTLVLGATQHPGAGDRHSNGAGDDNAKSVQSP